MIYHRGLPFEDEICVANSQDVFEVVNYSEVFDEKYKNCTQASHCLIFQRCNYPIMKVYNPRAKVLMQVRFDGHLGFPGGIIDPGESPEEALLRELSEELDIPTTVVFDADDRLFIHYNKDKSLLLHFFVKEVSPELFREIELRSTKSREFGNEVLGVLRVPLYTMCDGYRGFPAFLQNKFIGNSKQQLIESLKKLKIMTNEEIEKAKNAKSRFNSTTLQMDLIAEKDYAKIHENDSFS